ncbi:MAG TPA: hypothetical protein PK668_21640 [Myxococcota bacterium]|nr:hypothetical protein [Myxococcota bacterium]HRY96082.1 hypothetical protein [Myxococcota bacterium]
MRTLPWMLWVMAAVVAWPEEAHVSTEPVAGQLHAEYKPGFLTDLVVPGDPVQELEVAGFKSAGEALGFAQGGLHGGAPVFAGTLRRGDSLSFTGASHVVFYHRGAGGEPELLSVTRCHADLHLLVGFCGYQLQLSANLPAPPAPQVEHGLWR